MVKTLSSNAGSAGSNPDPRTKIPQASGMKKTKHKREIIL